MNKILIILCIVTLACGKEYGMKKDLNKLYSQPFKIPSNLIVNYNGRDSLMDDLTKANLKFVIYNDSSNCISCYESKMDVWQLILKYADSFHGKLQFYFIFHPSKGKIGELRYILRNNRMNYPVLIDENGDFERLNPHLPKNKALHTFLLDENNKVILVGNPLHNKEIEKLFYKKTQELLSN